jgi:hypothetical protein
MAGYGNPYGVPGVALVQEGGGQVPPVPFQTPQNIFRFGEQTIWSTLLLPATAAIANGTNRVFSTPVGQVGQGFGNALSIAETNLKEGGRVPAGVAYDVFGVASEIVSTSTTADTGTIGTATNSVALIADALNIQHNGVLSWDFTQTTVDICPIILAGAGGGLFGALASTLNNVNVGHLSNGNGHIWMYRKHPVALPGNSTFSIVIRFGSRAAAISAANGATVRVTLLGYYKNVIEIG